MKFRQWLLGESPTIINYPNEDGDDVAYPKHSSEVKKRLNRFQKVSVMKNGMHVYSNKRKSEYLVHDPEINKIVANISLISKKENQGKVKKLSRVSKHSYANVKMGDIYAHIVNNHEPELHSSTDHSRGSFHNYSHIVKRKDINVSRRAEDGTELPIHKGDSFRKNYGHQMTRNGESVFVLKRKKSKNA